MSDSPTLRTRLVLVVAGIGLAGSLLTGCANAASDLNADTAAGLQDGVLSVTSAAAAGDFAGALTALETVQADLTEASAADGLTAARATEIQAAIDLVAIDLAAAVAADAPVEAPAEEPTEEPTEEPAETPDEEPVETPQAPEPVETPAETPTQTPDETEEPDESDEPDETEEETPEPAPASEKPGKDKSDTGACKNPEDCE